MPLTVSVRLDTATRSSHGGQRAHDLRDGVVPAYVDPSRTADNDIVIPIPTADAMASAALERRQSKYERGELTRNPRTIRRDAAVAIKGIITFSADAQEIINTLSREEQARRYQEAAEAVAAHVGTDVAGLIIHRDETAPHAHLVLSGYAPDGTAIARQLTKGRLSKAQDAAATAYEDLEIRRGKGIGQRIEDGDDPSSYIHRSVTELHRDLPREVEAARARAEAEREKAATAEKRREAAEQKAEAAEGKSQRLEKRVATYVRRAADAEQRAKDAEAEAERLQERFEALANADQKPPKQRRAKVPQTEQRGWGPCRRPVVTGERLLPYIKPSDAETWHGAVLKREKDARETADRRRKEAEAVERQRQQERERRQRLENALIQSTTAPAAFDDAEAAIWATDAVIVERYGVQMQIAAEIARVPPQEGLSDRQIASALYREGREQGWERQWFSVSENIAREIIALAGEDGRLDHVTFRDDTTGAANDLLREAREARDEDPMGEPPKPSKRNDLGI